jgi:hypothetical protein
VYRRIVHLNDKRLFFRCSCLHDRKFFNWSQYIINEVSCVERCLFGECSKNVDPTGILKDSHHNLSGVDQRFRHFRGISIRRQPYFRMGCIIKNKESSPVMINCQARLFALVSTESSAVDFSTRSLLWTSVKACGKNLSFRAE